MRELWLHLFMIPLTLSAALSLKSFRQGWPAPYKTFSLLLLFFLFTEAFNIVWKYWLHDTGAWHFNDSVYWSYNLSFFLQYALFFYFFYQILKGKIIKRIILLLCLLYYGFALYNLFFGQQLHNLNTYTFAVASLIILILCAIYFNQLKLNPPATKFSGNAMAWLVIGTFLYHATKYPFILGLKYLYQHNLDLAFAAYDIYLATGCIFYILFFIAYLCKRPLQQ